MKNALQKQYEHIYLKRHLKNHLVKGIREQLDNNSGESMWIGRSMNYLNAFFHSIESIDYQQNILKNHFLYDFSLDGAISSCITSKSDVLVYYIDSLPGMPQDAISYIKHKQKEFQLLLSLCEENSINLNHCFLDNLDEDHTMLIEFNGIDLKEMQAIYFGKKDYNDIVQEMPPYENHGFLTMRLIEQLTDYFQLKMYKNLKSLISRETEHLFNSYNNNYRAEYLDFCFENTINPFCFSNEDEEMLIDLNFQLN